MPLYEWELSEIVTDFSSNCRGNLPSHLTTYLGESLDGRDGSENLNVGVRRSWNDEVLDRMSAFGSWLFEWSLIEVGLSIIYLWWFLFRDKQDRTSHLGMAVFLTAIAIFMCLNLSQVVRVAGPVIHGPLYYFGVDCHATITFNARLVKMYYETLTILFAGILMELGALGMMLHPIVRAIIQRKESSKSVVG